MNRKIDRRAAPRTAQRVDDGPSCALAAVSDFRPDLIVLDGGRVAAANAAGGGAVFSVALPSQRSA